MYSLIQEALLTKSILLMNEREIEYLVTGVIRKVHAQFCREFSSIRSTLHLSEDLIGSQLNGQPDIVLLRCYDDINRSPNHLLIVEVKTSQFLSGYSQLFMYLNTVMESRNWKDKSLPLFGIVTNLEQWSFVRRDVNGYKIYNRFNFFTSHLPDIESWNKNSSLVMETLYNIFLYLLNED